MRQVAAMSAHCPQVLHRDSTQSRRMASRSGVVSRDMSARASIRQAIRADADDKLIGVGLEAGALARNSTVACRAASNHRGTSYTKATATPHQYNFWGITGVKLDRRQASFEVMSWQASSRTIAYASVSAGLSSASAFSVIAVAARSKHPAKLSRFSGVVIPRNSKSAACRIAPSQMAVAGEISVSVMGARYGADLTESESPKGAGGTALNHSPTTGVVNVPGAGF